MYENSGGDDISVASVVVVIIELPTAVSNVSLMLSLRLSGRLCFW